MPLLTPDVEPLWISRYDYQPGWHLPRHTHRDFFQIILIVSGAGEAQLGSRRQAFSAGQLLFLRPGLLHGLSAGAAEPVRTLDTKFRVHRKNLRSACRRVAPFHARAQPAVIALLEAIYAEARRHAAMTKDLCQSLFTQLLLLLVQDERDGAPAPPVARLVEGALEDRLTLKIERYLRENCVKAVDQESLGAALHYSYRHLHGVWRRRHRESPLQTLWRYRVERAVQLIRYSDYELKRIAELAGFATIHHFTRVFTRLNGVSPARWRARERDGIRQDVAISPGFVNRALTIQSGGAAGVQRRKRGARIGLRSG